MTQIEEYRPVLIGMINRRTRNRATAEDYTQEVMLQAWQASQKGLPEPEYIRSYMGKIAINIMKEKWRTERRKERHLQESMANGKMVSAKPAFDQECPIAVQSGFMLEDLTIEAIKKKLRTLTPWYQEVFQLYYVEGHTFQEIADMCSVTTGRSVTTGTLKKNMFKLRAKLADLDPGLN